MIYQALSEAADKGELLLINGGMCRFHIRKDGQCTIREIIVLPDHRCRRLGRWPRLGLDSFKSPGDQP